MFVELAKYVDLRWRVAAGVVPVFLFLVAFVFPASADPLRLIDYAALFEKYSDRIVRNADGTKSVTLPDGVEIIDTGDGYFGHDPKGAVGCVAMLFIEIEAAGKRCPDLMDDKQATGFEANKAKLLSYYASNAFPPVPVERAAENYGAIVSTVAARKKQKACDAASLDGVRTFLPGLLDVEALETLLATPRLPVMDPCL
ncbi:hypothetical protein C8N35_110111 [Breoghania corrubedonensis]|uniref:Uncharacterized protein n=1 Tax=Breoghania corrubedonensis TaxID=665038 RepID=A0A2T5V1L3_9HYPH|nr:hypothetical protein [Breoghania corrubedonensis]PTW57632.1 hypothetical protein C8N35_110111 [Breoghania corrubedonensis]